MEVTWFTKIWKPSAYPGGENAEPGEETLQPLLDSTVGGESAPDQDAHWVTPTQRNDGLWFSGSCEVGQARTPSWAADAR